MDIPIAQFPLVKKVAGSCNNKLVYYHVVT